MTERCLDSSSALHTCELAPVMTGAMDEGLLSGAEVISRVAALRAQLSDEQADTEARRYHSEDLHRQLVESGVYRVLLPRRFGGLELSMADFFRAVSEVSRGCVSTGWCVALAGAHVLTVSSIFNEAVQREVFAPDGDFRCPARAVPDGTANATGDGRWIVKGRWDYCSGAPYATHFLAAVRMPAADRAETFGCALVPRSQWRMLDDWGNQLGLKGSGSHSIEVDAVVGRDYVLPVSIQDVHPGEDTPGYEIHRNPMYAGRTAGFNAGELTAVGIGAVRCALDQYARTLRTRKTYWVPQVVRGEDPQYQQWYGHAQVLVDIAEAGLLHMANLYDQFCREHVDGIEEFSAGKDARAHGDRPVCRRDVCRGHGPRDPHRGINRSAGRFADAAPVA